MRYNLYNFLKKGKIIRICLRIWIFFINFAAEFVGKVTELSMDGVGKVTFECIIQVRKVTYDKQAFR